MVGIVLATHGKFSEGILQSAEMIFGEQENIKAVTLMPEEGPNDVNAKMKEAIATFDNQDEVLFLVDLWGGTPFNQASTLLEDNQEKWAIVGGLNLPMLIEALASRQSMGAHELATHIAKTAVEGVKVLPEKLEPISESVAADAKPMGAIAPGTVIGDGKIKFVLSRIDSRLLHGQVATSWTKAVKPNRIIVVSDAVAKDGLRKKLIEQAAPPGVKAHVIPITKMIEIAKDPRFGDTRALVLFENPGDVLRVVDGGVDLGEINVGSMSHSKGKAYVTNVLSMSNEDVAAFDKLTDKGLEFDVRKVPNDSRSDFKDILKKAKAELAK